jgi:PAS domain-containing protein
VNDFDKTKEQLIDDLAKMRRRVTALEKTDEALRTTRLQLSEAMDLAGIVYWEIDLNTNTFIFNDAFYALYGTTAEAEGGYRMEAAEYRRRPTMWQW